MEAIKTEVRGNTRVVSFGSEKLLGDAIIRQAGQELLDTAADFASGENVVLNFEGVSFMSSAMLGKLIKFHKKCAAVGANLKVCSIAPDIFEVFKITKLNKMFDVYKDESQALASFG